MASYGGRVVLGVAFIVINAILFCLGLLQIIRSRKLFHDFKGYKIKLGLRVLNLWGTTLLLMMAFIDTDFWIYSSSQPPIIGDGVYYFHVIIKAICDITLCATGSLIVLSLIRSYFVANLGDPEFPSHITTFWMMVASSFSFIVFICVVVAVSAKQWIAVAIYSAIRLLYLFVAATYLAYTYYWVFYIASKRKNHYRNSILLLVFGILCFVGFIWMLIRAFTTDTHTLQSVVSAQLNDDGLSGVEYVGRFMILLLGWLGYWYVMTWYIKFVWTKSMEVESREITTRTPDHGSATSVI